MPPAVHPSSRRAARALAPALAAALLALCGCDAAGPRAAPGGRLAVVAGEDVWGSIAAQLGGDRVAVTSIVSNPSADPHAYEPSARDARSIATASVTIANGIGYDPWMARLIAASPAGGRAAIDVGRVVGVAAGGNPHRWYAPADVARVARAVTAAYVRLDPAHARYFRERARHFASVSLARYHALIATIRRRFAGVPVGGSESIVAPLAAALGLRLITPAGLLDAISEGTDPSAAAKARADAQIAGRRIAAWIYNSQNSTPDVSRLTVAARPRRIPAVAITETLVPPGASFQAWQSAQLERLVAALAQATGR